MANLNLEQNILKEICWGNAKAAHQHEQYPSAQHWYGRCLDLDPDDTDVHLAAAFPKALQRNWIGAIYHFNKAMANPILKNDAQYTRGLSHLMLGDYKNGFDDLETRLCQSQLKHIDDRFKHKKYWKGEECKGLYIYGEQGYGDVLMFSRFLPLIKDKFKVEKIYYEVQKPVYSFLKYNFRNNPEIEVVNEASNVEELGQTPAFKNSEYYIHLISLCRLFELRENKVPFMKFEAEPEFIEKWKHLKEKNTVSICCGGRTENENWQILEWNNRRNVDKKIIEEILGDKYNVVSLENYENTEIKSWSDTAGIIANSKFVITIDSGPAHMAGILSCCPIILLNHYQCCWRWGIDTKHSPWYTKKLVQIRQTEQYNWTNVYEELKEEIKKYVQ